MISHQNLCDRNTSSISFHNLFNDTAEYKDCEVSCDGLHGDLSHGNIIGKNAIECYCQIILYEPKVSAGCVTFVFLKFHEAHSARAVNGNATIASSHRFAE